MALKERRRGEGGVFIRGDKYYVYYTPPGQKQQKEPTGHNLACGGPVFVGDKDADRRADSYLDNIMKKMAAVELGLTEFVGRSSHKVTINDLLDVMMKQKEAEAIRQSGTRTAQYTDRSLVSGVKRCREWFGDMRAMQLTDTFWDGWKCDVLPDYLEEYEKATVNKTLAYLRQSLRMGVERRLITSVPGSISKVMFDDDELDNARQGFFEPAEFTALIEATDDQDYKDYYEFGYITGWRSGSIKKLTWSVVNMMDHTLLLKATKTKERYKNFMPLGDEGDTLFELIKRRWARRTYKKANGVTGISAYVFHRDGQPIGDIRKSWASTCKKAGLVEDNGGQVLQACETMSYTENKTETVPSKLFHDLRRTAVRDMLNAGVPWPTVKTITGHRTDSMLARYNIVVDAQKIEAIRQRMAWLVKRG